MVRLRLDILRLGHDCRGVRGIVVAFLDSSFCDEVSLPLLELKGLLEVLVFLLYGLRVGVLEAMYRGSILRGLANEGRPHAELLQPEPAVVRPDII